MSQEILEPLETTEQVSELYPLMYTFDWEGEGWVELDYRLPPPIAQSSGNWEW